MGKIGPKFSHLLTVRAEGADPPPYGQPDRKKTVFFLTTALIINMKIITILSPPPGRANMSQNFSGNFPGSSRSSPLSEAEMNRHRFPLESFFEGFQSTSQNSPYGDHSIPMEYKIKIDQNTSEG